MYRKVARPTQHILFESLNLEYHAPEFERYMLIISTKEVKAKFKKDFQGIRDEAVAKALAKKLRNLTIKLGRKPKSFTVEETASKRDLRFLSQLIDEHLEYLEKNRKNKQKFLGEMRSKYDWMLNIFTKNGVDSSTIQIEELDNTQADGLTWVTKISDEIDLLEGKKKGKPVTTTTRNNYIGQFRSVYIFAKNKRKIDIDNPFLELEKVNVRQEIKNKIHTIWEKEVTKLFDLLRAKTPLWVDVPFYSKKLKKKITQRRNVYRPYLLDGILLALALGYRSMNLATVKFSDLDLEEAYENGSALNGIIEVWDIKVNNQKKLIREDAMKPIKTRINQDILDVLNRFGYEKYKGTDTYIFAPDQKAQRDTLIKNVSKGFHEYMKLVDDKKTYMFKDLRKTQITREAKATSRKRASERVHGDLATTEGSYLDEEVLLATAEENPTVFKGVTLSKL